MITTYSEARVYLESLIKPIPYKNSDVAQPLYDPLERMRVLLTLLGNPETKFPSVQVSGTSGKGSTAYLLSHILVNEGYKTGLTVSPHLLNATERFQINENPISEEMFVSLVNELVFVSSQMKNSEVGEPTYFEALMGLTFLYFAREKVDIAIVEVGLEGRYDGTNTLNPLLFILTNISLDHTDFLGDTVEKIATEASAAIKPSGTVISGVTQKTVQEIVKKACEENNAVLKQYMHDFWVEIKDSSEEGVIFDYQSKTDYIENVFLSLRGEYQAENAMLAITAAYELTSKGFSLSKRKLCDALQTASFPGRLEVFHYAQGSTSYPVILDGAHNPAKMEALVDSLQKIYPLEDYIVIFACKKDKDITSMVRYLLAITNNIIITRFYSTTDAAKNASMSTEDIRKQLNRLKSDIKIESVETLEEAFTKALSTAKNNNKKILITGSLYLVGEAKQMLMELQ